MDRFKTKLESIFFVSFLSLMGLLPYKLRLRVMSWCGGLVTQYVPRARNRVDENLDKIYPDMPAGQRKTFKRDVGRITGRSYCGLMFNDDLAKQLDHFHVSGPGLAALEQANKEGRGAMIISAHFGLWEAARHVLKSRGMETGGIFKSSSNQTIFDRFETSVAAGGEPLVSVGPKGSRIMVKHLRQGGFMAILPDQAMKSNPPRDFMGHPAHLSDAFARMAEKMDLLVVPVFSTWRDNGVDIDVEFEEPIAATSSAEIMDAACARIESRIRNTPTQWFWLHRLWK